MIKLMKYLKKSAGYVVLIIALLFLQAYCDLSLPDYTSKIVNVGIQQSGIEDSVPEKIRKTSMDNLKLFMDEEEKETIDSYYEEDGDNLVLKDDVKSEEREKLNDILTKPMMIAASFSSGSDEVNEMLAKMGVPEGTDPMQAIAQMPEEALASMIGKISEKIDKMQPSILTQAGVAYVKSDMRQWAKMSMQSRCTTSRSQESKCWEWHLSPCSVQSAWYFFHPEWQQHLVMT